MARNNPLGKVAGTALSSIRHTVSTAGKVIGQAKGTAALGRDVTGQVGKAAASKAVKTAGGIVGRGKGRPSSPPAAPAQKQTARATSPATLRPVPDVNEAGHTPAENRTTEPPKQHGDPLADLTPTVGTSPPAEDTPAKEAAPKKAAAKKAPAKKAAAKKAPAKKAVAKKAPAKKAAAKKAPAKRVTATPADVAEVVEAAVAEDPGSTAAKRAPAKKAPAKKAPAKKAAARKAAETTPGDKLPARPAPAVTDKPLVDESELKAVASESETLQRAAEQQPE